MGATQPDAGGTPRLFRFLVRLLPLEFRTDFGDEMQEVFADERREARRHGRLAAARLWLRTVAAVGRTAVLQHADTLRLDVIQAGRALRASPGLSLIAIASLAIGIGANAAIAGFLNALFFRVPDGVAAPSDLVGISASEDERALPERLTLAELEAVRHGATTLTAVAGHTSVWVWMTTDADPIELSADAVTPSYFELLGVRPVVGRLFDASLRPGDPVAVLAHRVWVAQFGADRSVIGRQVTLNQRRFTIVGVADETFGGLYAGEMRAGLWIPAGTYQGWTAGESFDLVGRLAPGRTLPEARAEIGARVHGVRGTPAPLPPEPPVRVEPLRGLHPARRGDLTRAPLLLSGIVAILLLVACANLAGLLLARAASRRHEMAVRVSLGATRSRLLRQLLTESLLLATIGGAAALLVALWSARLIEVHFAYLFDRLRIVFDGRVLAFTAAATLASGLAFGLGPAWASSGAPFGALRGRQVGHRGRRASWRALLLAGQVASSVALLVGALLMAQSLVHVVGQPGFAQHDVAHYRLRPSRNHYDAARAAAYYREVTARLGRVPGVRAVVFASTPPSPGWAGRALVTRPDTRSTRTVDSLRNDVSPGFFRSLGMPLARGREFDDGDAPGSAPVAIVTQSLAARLWGAADPLGRSLAMSGGTYTVVGVARDVHAGHGVDGPLPCVYFPHRQQRGVDARLFVRTQGDAAAMVPRLRRELVAVDPLVHVGQEMTLSRRTALSFETERLTAQVLTGAGGAALALTVIGLYGMVSFWVAQRTREIGVRMSLGATARGVVGLVVRQGMTPVAVGLLVGLALAYGSMRLLGTLVYGVSVHDPASFAGAAAAVTAVALAACSVPARRATRVDPARALRAE